MNKSKQKMMLAGQYGKYQVWASKKSGAVVDPEAGIYWPFKSWQEANDHAYKFSKMSNAEVCNF